MSPFQQANPQQHPNPNTGSSPDHNERRTGKEYNTGGPDEVVVPILDNGSQVGAAESWNNKTACSRSPTFSGLVNSEGSCVADGEYTKVETSDPSKTHLWREVSADYLHDLDLANGENTRSAVGRKRRSKGRPKSFDFGVNLDPPTKLIESFLQRQAASGKVCLDMDMDLMEKLNAVAVTRLEETNLCSVAENSETNGFTTQQSVIPSSSGAEIVKSEEESASPTPNPSLKSSPGTTTWHSGVQRGVSFEPTQVFECPHGELNTSISFGEASAMSPGTRDLGKSVNSLHDDSRESDSSGDEAQVVRRSGLASLNRSQTRSRLADLPLAEAAKFGPKSAQLRSGPVKSGLLPNAGMLGPLEEEEDDPLKDADFPERFRKDKFSFTSVLQWIAFFLIVGGLVSSLTVPALKQRPLWSMALWKWVLVVFLVFCGRLVSGWIIRILVLILERSFLLRKRVLYFVYGLRKGVQNCLWFAFALLAWRLVLDPKVQGTTHSNVLPYVTKVLNCFLIAAIIWLIKLFCVKVLASSFHVSTYFERIRESLFGQWVLETLSGMPVIEMEQEANLVEEVDLLKKAGAKAPDLPLPTTKKSGMIPLSKSGLVGGRSNNKLAGAGKSGMIAQGKSGLIIGGGKSGLINKSGMLGGRSQQSIEGKQVEQEGITVDDLHRLNQKNISAWNMKRMMNMVRYRGIYTLAHVIDRTAASTTEDESLDVEIQSEWQAKAAAKKIFKNVAKPGARHIVKTDLMRFIRQADVDRAMALFEGASESGKITKGALKNFTVHVFQERRVLSLSLNDTKTAVKKLHSLVDVIVSVIILIICLLVLGLATTHLLLLVSSQLVLVVFIFGNTCKTVFEAIVFLFVMHPFDVGDRCIVDGNQVVVEEMNLLSTLFMRYDGEKIWYPNPLLATKYILNCHRTPDTGDTFDFSIHASTPVEKISTLKERIAKYIASKPGHWLRDHNLIVQDIEDSNKMKMQLMVNHTINYHNILERQIRRSDLILEVKKMLQDLEINYRLLPQEVQISNVEEVRSKVLGCGQGHLKTI